LLRHWHFPPVPSEAGQAGSGSVAGAPAAEGCSSGAAPSSRASPLPTLAQEISVLTGLMLWGSLGDDLLPH